MTYELPEPARILSNYPLDGKQQPFYSAEQMQTAHAAGREAMREEAIVKLDKEYAKSNVQAATISSLLRRIP